jgi:hypothetical protein
MQKINEREILKHNIHLKLEESKKHAEIFFSSSDVNLQDQLELYKDELAYYSAMVEIIEEKIQNGK